MEDEIITGQEFSSMSLMMVQDFYRYKDFYIFVIGANSDKILRSFEIVSLVLEAFDNGKHFMIMDIIVAFHRDALLGPKCNKK